jgi:anti-anti-sigma factor
MPDPGEIRVSLPVEQLIDLGQLTMFSKRDGDVHCIAVFGELDLATVGGVTEELKRVEATDAGTIVVDLSGLSFMDSNGVRLLLQAHARSLADGDRLTLRRGPAAVRRVLALTGVEDLLPFAD